MKIRINEKEVYELETSEELSQEEFFVFKERINMISKLINDPFSDKGVFSTNPFSERKIKFSIEIHTLEDANTFLNLCSVGNYDEVKNKWYKDLPYVDNDIEFKKKLHNDKANIKKNIENGIFETEKEKAE